MIGDLDDTAALAEALDGCDAVIHLAACADVGIVLEDPAGAERANSRGTLSVLEACRDRGRQAGRLREHDLGLRRLRRRPRDRGVRLSACPSTSTRRRSWRARCTARSYAELYGLEPTILRFGIPYGPRARPATVIAIFIDKALAGEPLTLAGDGHADAALRLRRGSRGWRRPRARPEAASRVYNLAGTETVTIRELAEIVRDEVGRVEIVHTPGRSGDFSGAEISSVRASEELGWAASTPIRRRGLAATVAWLEHGQPAPRTGTAPAGVVRPRASSASRSAGPLRRCSAPRSPTCSPPGFGFGEGQLHAVALTSLAASLIAMSLSPASPLRGRDLIGATRGRRALRRRCSPLPETPARARADTRRTSARALLSAVGAAIAIVGMLAAARRATRRPLDRPRARNRLTAHGTEARRPLAWIRSRIRGNAARVRRHEPGAL